MPFQKKITRMKKKNIIELPISGSSKINNTGRKPINRPNNISLKESMLLFVLDKKFDNSNMVAIFINSEGCKLKPPIAIQLFAPETFLPISKTIINKKIPTRYAGIEMILNEFVGIK
jgi:hypothetical protein